MRPRDKSGGGPYALGYSSASTTTSRRPLSWAFSAPIARAADMTGRIRGHRKPNRVTTFTDLNSSGWIQLPNAIAPKIRVTKIGEVREQTHRCQVINLQQQQEK